MQQRRTTLRGGASHITRHHLCELRRPQRIRAVPGGAAPRSKPDQRGLLRKAQKAWKVSSFVAHLTYQAAQLEKDSGACDPPRRVPSRVLPARGAPLWSFAQANSYPEYL
jgi:hypothetical protein